MRRTRAILALAVGVLGLALVLFWIDARRGDGPPPAGAGEAATDAGAAGTPGEAASGSRESPRGAGEVRIVGRLVDQDGLAFAGLRVVARRAGAAAAEARTDEEGRFELGPLARGPLELVLDADFDPDSPLGERTLAWGVPALALDLGEGAELLDAGTHVLPRSRPFWIVGRVELDEDWAREKGVWLGDVRIELSQPTLEELGDLLRPEHVLPPGEAPDWRNPPWRIALPEPPRVEEDGSFRMAVETPHDPFFVRVWLKRFEPAERLVWPVADEVREETFRLP